jgi:putative drug exporter of the RND superfamily
VRSPIGVYRRPGDETPSNSQSQFSVTQKLRSIAGSLAELPGGRRTKFAVITVWVVILFAIGPLAGKFEDAQENDPADYLPANAESVRTLDRLDGFPSDDQADAITVFHRDGGLSAADTAAIEGVRTTVNERVRPAINAERPETVAETGPAQISSDGATALLTTPITVPEEASGDAEDLLTDTPEEIKGELGSLPSGLEAEVTGPAGFAADAVEVFNDINGTLLLATAALVLILLIVIYRSPIFWAIPFFSVLLAELTTRGLGYLIAEAGVTVTGQSGGILPVLVFGAGTDYALLMVSRYREELRRHEDKHDAIRVTLRRTSPVILASGGTVMAALLTLSFAEVTGTSGLGPIGALGIAMAMVSMLTILPALLTVFGRRAFWPFIPRYGSEGADETHGAWRRIAEWVARGPRRVWIGTTAVLAVMITGLVFLNSDLTTGNMFRDEVDSVKGQELLEAGFPAGANAPTNVLVTDESRLEDVRTAVAAAPGVAEVSPRVERGPAGVKLEVTLDQDPYSTAGFDLIPGIRGAAEGAAGDVVLVGGPTAEEYDLRQSASRDNRLIVPIALVVVFLILAALLRAITAPLVLIGTVIVSYFAALGIGAFFFENVFDFPGMGPDLPLFAFIFLVALGIDYNIFLMARVREETLTRGTRDGTIRGLAVTGAVITSAGLVLAGTFSTLAVLPLVFLTEIGFVIAVGVLIDTFLVRSLLVPALVLEIGDRVWWPSALARLAGDQRRERVPRRTVVETEE